SQRSRSCFAVGSAFSWMTRLAEVWRMKSVHRPSPTPAWRTSAATCCVTSCKPWPGVRTLSCLSIGARFERRDRRQFLALQEFEECATGGRDVVDVRGNAELVDRRDRVAAAGDGVGLRPGDGARQRLGAFGEGLVLEHADRSVPDDGACPSAPASSCAVFGPMSRIISSAATASTGLVVPLLSSSERPTTTSLGSGT